MSSLFTYDGASDQYSIDVDVKYPMFSDYSISDYSLNKYPSNVYGPEPPPPIPRKARSFENKYQVEQQGIPASYACNCTACPMHPLFPRGPGPMRQQTIDERARSMMIDSQKCLPKCSLDPIVKSKKLASKPSDPDIIITPVGNISSSQIFVICFIFILFVFICCFYGKALGELKTQLKSLKDLLKR